MFSHGRRSAILFLAVAAVAADGLGACGGRATQRPSGGGGATGSGTGGGSGGVSGSETGGAGQAGGPAGYAGAGGSGGAGPGGMSGGAGGAPCQGGAELAYLVRSLATTAAGDGGPGLHGFDLDGRTSDGTAPDDCNLADATAPDGRRGIDNVIAGLWGEDFSGIFNGSYARGVSPIVIRLKGVDDLDQDDCVDVEWSNASWVGAPVDPASPGAAGQALRQQEPIARLPGARISGGRLLVSGNAPFALRAWRSIFDGFSDNTVHLDWLLTVLRLSFVTGTAGLTEGELGGQMEPEDLYRAYAEVYGALVPRSLLESVVRPDLPSDSARCALLSAGYGFEAVRVTLIP